MKSTQRASLEEGGNISSRSSKLTLIIIPFVSLSLSRFRKIKILLLLLFTIINLSFVCRYQHRVASIHSTMQENLRCHYSRYVFLIYFWFSTFSLVWSSLGLVTGAICRPQNKPPLCKCSCFQDSKVTLHPPSPPLSLHSQCRSSSQVAPCPVFTCNMYCGRYFYVPQSYWFFFGVNL